METEYSAFPNESGRNWNQEHLEIPLLLALIDVPQNARILEIGTGRGVALRPLAQRLNPSLLVGLDIDQTLLTEARRSDAAHLACGDARRLPWRDQSFDVVIDFGTCYHIARSIDALREVVRILRVGGLYISETKASQFLSHPFRSRGKQLPWKSVPELEPLRNALLWQAHRRAPRA